jgi:hypothetical protein
VGMATDGVGEGVDVGVAVDVAVIVAVCVEANVGRTSAAVAEGWKRVWVGWTG